MKFRFILLVIEGGALAAISILVKRRKTKIFDRRCAERLDVSKRAPLSLGFAAEPSHLVLCTGVFALGCRQLSTVERLALCIAPTIASAFGLRLKRAVPRERPNKNRFNSTGGESYPSTHTACSVALGLTAADIARAHGVGRWVWVLPVAWAALVARERVCEAAHWPSDVLGGAVLGALSWNLATLRFASSA
jgi:membrane-associated phospholipid phosphatase